MKKLLLVLTIILVTGGVFAQQIAYIDTSVIMKSEYISQHLENPSFFLKRNML